MISRRTFFSSISMKSFSSTEITNWIKPGEGIIHIHNWFNMISYKQISELIDLGYKVVCTLHDERMLTGAAITPLIVVNLNNLARLARN